MVIQVQRVSKYYHMEKLEIRWEHDANFDIVRETNKKEKKDEVSNTKFHSHLRSNHLRYYVLILSHGYMRA